MVYAAKLDFEDECRDDGDPCDPGYYGSDVPGYGWDDDYSPDPLDSVYHELLSTLRIARETAKRGSRPRRRAKGSLTLGGLRRLFGKGQRVFWVASACVGVVERQDVVAPRALPGTLYEADPRRGYTIEHKTTRGVTLYWESLSTIDKNLIRNFDNDWWVFPTEAAARRYVRRAH